MTHVGCYHHSQEYRRIFSTHAQKKYQEAIQWFETRQLVSRDLGRYQEVDDDIRQRVLTDNLVSV